MRIIDNFNKILSKYIQARTILFGQNITTGSRISGMTNFLDHMKKKVEIFNTQNSENTLIGFGLGLALNARKSIYFVKQLDFILLGIDHIVNTLNSLILEKTKGNFSIITYIVDSGNEGPQSRFHSLQEIATMSNVNCVYLIFPEDIRYNLQKINKNIFNIFCLSQKNSQLVMNPKCIKIYEKGKIFKYSKGNKATILAVGFSSYFVYNNIIRKNVDKYDFFSINNPLVKNFDIIIESAIRTKKVMFFDDSRSSNKNLLGNLELSLKNLRKDIKFFKYYRKDSIKQLYVNEDIYKPTLEKI
jgi:pyruvate/2-oxoglutarate/acetoin dehydrogenase E1 component